MLRSWPLGIVDTRCTSHKVTLLGKRHLLKDDRGRLPLIVSLFVHIPVYSSLISWCVQYGLWVPSGILELI